MLSEVKKRLEGPTFNIDFGGKGWGRQGKGISISTMQKGAILRKCVNTFVPHCRNCGIEHWFPRGADGRAAGGRAVYGHVITKFSGMGRFTYPWCSAGALLASELRYKLRIAACLCKN